MTEQEYRDAKAVLEADVAEARRKQSSTALNVSMGKLKAADATKAASVTAAAEGALETLKLAFAEAKKENAKQVALETRASVDAARASVSEKLDEQVKLAKKLRALAEELGTTQQSLEQLSKDAGAELAAIRPYLRHEFEHLHKALLARPQHFRTKFAGHMAKAGVVFEGVNFDSARVDAGGVSVDEWMAHYNASLKSRLAVLDTLPFEE